MRNKLFMLFCAAIGFLPCQGKEPVRASPIDAAPPIAASNAANPSATAPDMTAPDTTAPHPPDSVRKAAFHFVDSVFARSAFRYEIVQPDIPKDVQTILIRFNNAIATNPQWFLAYRDKYAASGQPLPYSERFGITPQEYQRLQHMEATPPQLVAVDSQQVNILRDAGFIHFRSEGETHLLDYLLIDSVGHQLLYGGDSIPFTGRTSTGPTSPYGQWQGFTWRLEKTDITRTLDAGKATATVIEVNLGLPVGADDKKVFLRIKYQDIKAGTPTANMELLGYIR